MNEKTYNISSEKPADAEAFTARIYPESVLKAVWRRIRKPSRKTILKLLPAPDFTVLRAAELTLSHGYRYFCIINEAAPTTRHGWPWELAAPATIKPNK